MKKTGRPTDAVEASPDGTSTVYRPAWLAVWDWASR